MVRKLIVVPATSSCRSSTTPWSSTCAALVLDTFGIACSLRVAFGERRDGGFARHGAFAPSLRAPDQAIGPTTGSPSSNPKRTANRLAAARDETSILA